MTRIFDPVQVGSIEAKNRIFMSALTRARGTRDHVPTPIMVEYYAQRADAGLIVSEGTGISREGLGWPYAPGIWSDEQVEKWKPITAAVHAKGGKIALQLWHMGRAVHSSITGLQPVSSSATAYPTKLHTYEGKQDPEQARPLTKADIRRILVQYAHAARNAIAAGFDGVEIHGANGYLIDQFLRDSANKRTDEYGGSIENRVRFLDEVLTAVVGAIGADRTGIRFSPNGDSQGVIDSNPGPLFAEVARIVEKHKLAFITLRELGPNTTFGSTDQPKQHDIIRENYHGILVLNQEYTRDEALELVESDTCDAVAFGRPFIANPDLVEIIRTNTPWIPSDMKTWYSQGAEGYTQHGAKI